MIAALATSLNLINGKLLKSTAAEEKNIGKNVDRRENIGKNPVDVSVVAKEFIYVGTMNMIRLCSYKNIDMDDTTTQFEHSSGAILIEMWEAMWIFQTMVVVI